MFSKTPPADPVREIDGQQFYSMKEAARRLGCHKSSLVSIGYSATAHWLVRQKGIVWFDAQVIDRAAEIRAASNPQVAYWFAVRSAVEEIWPVGAWRGADLCDES